MLSLSLRPATHLILICVVFFFIYIYFCVQYLFLYLEVTLLFALFVYVGKVIYVRLYVLVFTKNNIKIKFVLFFLFSLLNYSMLCFNRWTMKVLTYIDAVLLFYSTVSASTDFGEELRITKTNNNVQPTCVVRSMLRSFRHYRWFNCQHRCTCIKADLQYEQQQQHCNNVKTFLWFVIVWRTTT